MNIKQMPIDELLRYENNPRDNAKAVEYVANSIAEFGFKVPIIIDCNNIIVAGDTRYQAAKRLKLKEVPCIIADDLTDQQVKAFRLADNKVSEFSKWNVDKLEDELQQLLETDMLGFGFEAYHAAAGSRTSQAKAMANGKKWTGKGQRLKKL